MFCTKCGSNNSDESKYCFNCGNNLHVANKSNPVDIPNSINNLLFELSDKEKTSAILWLVLGCIQIIIGIFLNWIILIIAIFNIVNALNKLKHCKRVLNPYPTLVDDYDKSLVSIIIVLVANLIIGALIGVLGSIYDLSTRNYVIKNREKFLSIINKDYVSSFQDKQKKDINTYPSNSIVTNNIPQKIIGTSYKLEINHTKQFFINNPVISININNIENLLLKNGENFCKNIPEGHYQIEFSYTIRKTIIDLEINNDTLIEVKFNKITGKIDISSNNNFLITISK